MQSLLYRTDFGIDSRELPVWPDIRGVESLDSLKTCQGVLSLFICVAI